MGHALTMRDGKPIVEDVDMALFNSTAVPRPSNDDVLRATDQSRGRGKDEKDGLAGVLQKAASERGHSSDSFVSIDDLSRQIARFSSSKNNSHNGGGKVPAMFMEPNEDDVNGGAEAHFGPKPDESADDLQFDKSLSGGDKFEDLGVGAGPERGDMSMVLNFGEVDGLMRQRAVDGPTKSEITKPTGLRRHAT